MKINCVVQKGVNEEQVSKLVNHFRHTGVIVRFIEYMDVGRTNGWQLAQVVPSEKILDHLQKEFDLIPVDEIFLKCDRDETFQFRDAKNN